MSKLARPEPVLVTIYITKYWLSKGIFVAEGDVRDKDGPTRMVVVPVRGSNHYYHRQDWHLTLEAAQERVRELAVAKRKSLQKAMDALQKKTDKALKDPVPYPVPGD